MIDWLAYRESLILKSIQQNVEVIEISENPEKENVCEVELEEIECKKKKKLKKETVTNGAIILEESADVDSKRKKKKKMESSNDDVISLKQFLSEEKMKDTDTKARNNNSVNVEESGSTPQKFMKTKQVMKSLFIKNPTLLFNGSNINEIKGYGSTFYE